MVLPLTRAAMAAPSSRARACAWLCRVLFSLPRHCRASDPVWRAYSEDRSLAARVMLLSVLRAAQASAVLPPPPGTLRSLQALAALLLMCAASAAAVWLFLRHVVLVFEEGFQLALHAYILENLLAAVQPPIILAAAWLNLGRSAATLAAVMAAGASTRAGLGVSGPQPAHSFVAITVLIYLMQIGRQVLLHRAVYSGIIHTEDSSLHVWSAAASVASAWTSLCALVLERLSSLVLTLAAFKIRVVNRKLKTLASSSSTAYASSATWLPPPEPPLDAAVQRGMLWSVASRWEATVQQVSGLLGSSMLGVPLLYSLLQMSIGLVTSSALAAQDSTEPAIRLVKLFDLVSYLVRVASLSVATGSLYREAKETETIIGALDTTTWPIRDRQRVSRLLHLSREAAKFRVCGLVSLDHSFLFAVMGNTVTYLVMLLQYPILTPGKAAAVLNQTDAKAAT